MYYDIYDVLDDGYFDKLIMPVRERDFIMQFMTQLADTSEDEIAFALEEDVFDYYRGLVRCCHKSEMYYQGISAIVKGKQFFIKPTAYEVDNGVLFHGDRFTPFSESGNCIEELKLKADYGKRIIKKKITVAISELKKSSAFYSDMTFYQAAAHQHDSSWNVFYGSRAPENISFKAFNFKSFYKKYGFSEGDMLLVTIDDYCKNSFTVEYVPSDSFTTKFNNASEWKNVFETHLTGLFENYDPYRFLTIQKQVAYVLLCNSLAERDSATGPVFDLVTFIRENRSFTEFTRYGEVLLWFSAGELPEYLIEDADEDDDGDEFEQALDMLSTTFGGVSPDSPFSNDFDFFSQMLKGKSQEAMRFEQLLEIMRFSLDEDEIEAFCRDEFYTGRKSFDKFMGRCFDDRIQRLYSEYEKEFTGLVKGVWNRVETSYNRFSDDLAGKMRHEALKGIELQLLWVREIDNTGLSTFDAPREKVQAIGEMVSTLAGFVITLNTDEFVDKNMADKTVRNIIEHNGVMSMQMDDILENLRKN